MNNSLTFSQKILSASKWSFLGEFASKTVSPLIYLILARLLSPDDFGVATIATMIISFSQIIWDAGLAKALIRINEKVEDAANIVFWTNAIMALLVYFLLFSCANLASEMFHETRAVKVLRVQGLQVIFSSFSSVHIALLQRDFDFKVLFKTRMLSSFGPAIASVPLALAGLGYWALVGGALAGSILQSLMLWVKSSWRPSFSYNLALAKEMMRFSIWVTGEALLAWFYLWIDAVIVGSNLTSSDLGLYKTGDFLVSTAFGMALSPVVPVLFSAFAKLQWEKSKLNSLLMNSTIVISVISIPLGIGLFISRHSIESFLFPNEWNGLSEVIGLFALLHGFTWINGAQIEAFRASGRPDVNTKVMFFGLIYSIPIFLFSIRYGLAVFIWVRLLCAIPTFIARLVLGKVFFHLSWLAYVIKLRLFFLVLVMTSAAIWSVQNLLASLMSPSSTLLITCLIGTTVYAIFVVKKRTQLGSLIGS